MTLRGILTLRCPHCLKGSVRAGLFRTAKHCPVCGHLFEIEPGFYAGAIYSLYGMAGFVGGVTALFCLFVLDQGPFASVLCGSVAVALVSPYLFWLSRTAFIHAEERFFRKMKGL
ncbi:MAG: hypothetical protein V4498_10115 [candidate division FCPU426 bacterium]